MRVLVLGSLSSTDFNKFLRQLKMGQIFQHLRLPMVGTNANNSAQARVFTLNVNNTSSNSNANIGSQVTFRLLKNSEKISPRLLAEERAIPFSVSRLNLENSGKRLETR